MWPHLACCSPYLRQTMFYLLFSNCKLKSDWNVARIEIMRIFNNARCKGLLSGLVMPITYKDNGWHCVNQSLMLTIYLSQKKYIFQETFHYCAIDEMMKYVRSLVIRSHRDSWWFKAVEEGDLDWSDVQPDFRRGQWKSPLTLALMKTRGKRGINGHIYHTLSWKQQLIGLAERIANLQSANREGRSSSVSPVLLLLG